MAEDTELTDKKKAAVLESLGNGASILSACLAAGIARECYYKWCKKDADFKAKALETRASCVSVVEDALYYGCTHPDKNGKVNATAIIFYLCNRAPDRWKHVNRVELAGAPDAAPVRFEFGSNAKAKTPKDADGTDLTPDRDA